MAWDDTPGRKQMAEVYIESTKRTNQRSLDFARTPKAQDIFSKIVEIEFTT
jgi:hypothetical protein